MSRHPHVLVFDSGVGGLSVAREIRAAHPQCQLSYASDNGAFPYGSKTPEWLVERVEKVIAALIDATAPDVIVVACNTASTVTLPHLRSRFATPFVGVVPAIKPAAHITRSQVIGVLATPATVERPYTRQLIRDHAAHCHVLLHGSGELVLQAERKLAGKPVDTGAIRRELELLLGQAGSETMDTIVLACTHFPLLQQELELAADQRFFQWVDSGEAIARRVGYWIGQLPLCETAYAGPQFCYLTAPSPVWPQLQATLPLYLGATAPALEVLPIAGAAAG